MMVYLHELLSEVREAFLAAIAQRAAHHFGCCCCATLAYIDLCTKLHVEQNGVVPA